MEGTVSLALPPLTVHGEELQLGTEGTPPVAVVDIVLVLVVVVVTVAEPSTNPSWLLTSHDDVKEGR